MSGEVTEMADFPPDLDLRVARLEEEVGALEREVEALREELRALARLVERGDIAGPEVT